MSEGMEDRAYFLARALRRGRIAVGKLVDKDTNVWRVTVTVDNETRSMDMTRELLEQFHWKESR